MFGQECVGGKSWRSLLNVHMSRESMGRFVSSLQKMSGPTLAEITVAAKIDIGSLTKTIVEPEQAFALTANLAITAISGNETCLDFYQASPFAIRNVMQTKKLPLDPVVRVDMPTALFLSLVEGIRALGIEAESGRSPL